MDFVIVLSGDTRGGGNLRLETAPSVLPMRRRGLVATDLESVSANEMPIAAVGGVAQYDFPGCSRLAFTKGASLSLADAPKGKDDVAL